MPRPILLDTDLGTDPDDLLALLTVAGSPELDLAAVTTSYGDTTLRAHLVADLLATLGLSAPIGAGPTTPLSGAPVWYAGNEQHHAPTQRLKSWPDAVEIIVETARARPGLNIVAIGPLTNVAAALNADASLPDLLEGVAVMGGHFGDSTTTEHNFRSDAVAAATVLNSRVAVRVIGLEQTLRVPVHREQLREWDLSTTLASRVKTDTEWWMDFHGDDHIFVHDPLTVLQLTHPHLFAHTRALIQIQSQQTAALSWTADRSGTVDVVTDLDVQKLGQLVIDRVATAIMDSPPDQRLAPCIDGSSIAGCSTASGQTIPRFLRRASGDEEQ